MGLFNLFKKKKDVITSITAMHIGDYVSCESPTEHDVDYTIYSINGETYTYDCKTNLVDFDEQDHEEGYVFLKNDEVTIKQKLGDNIEFDFELGYLKRNYYLCHEYIEKEESHSPNNVIFLGKNNNKTEYNELILKDGTIKYTSKLKSGKYTNEMIYFGTYEYDSLYKMYICTMNYNLTLEEKAKHKYQDTLDYFRFAIFIEPDGSIWCSEYVNKDHMTDLLYPKE